VFWWWIRIQLLSDIVNMVDFLFHVFYQPTCKWIFKCWRSILSLTDVINEFLLRSYESLHCGLIYGNAMNCLELKIEHYVLFPGFMFWSIQFMQCGLMQGNVLNCLELKIEDMFNSLAAFSWYHYGLWLYGKNKEQKFWVVNFNECPSDCDEKEE